MAKIKRAVIDREGCIGAASCLVVYPEVYEMDDENKVLWKLKDGKFSPDEVDVKQLDVESVDDDTLLLSAQSCPVGAIALFDEDNNQIFPETE